MKARIRKTGEVVEIITYSGGTSRNECIDRVSYIDSKGVEHPREPLNFYWDFEQIPDVKEYNFPKIDWEQRRYVIAKEIYPTILEWYATGTCSSEDSVIRSTLKFTDKLIKELKNNIEQVKANESK